MKGRLVKKLGRNICILEQPFGVAGRGRQIGANKEKGKKNRKRRRKRREGSEKDTGKGRAEGNRKEDDGKQI